jgi:predicted phosphate transport protein (TIGR00153 family)
MTSDIDAANEKANEVEELEHESDILEQGLLNDLYEHEKLFDPVSIAQLKEIIGRIGSISDRAEDTSDMIPIVGYRFRP